MYNSNLTQISSELIRKILCDVVEDQLNTNVFQININSCRNTGLLKPNAAFGVCNVRTNNKKDCFQVIILVVRCIEYFIILWIMMMTTILIRIQVCI